MDDDGSDSGNRHEGYCESDDGMQILDDNRGWNDGQGGKGELEVANSDGNGENDSNKARVGLRK